MIHAFLSFTWMLALVGIKSAFAELTLFWRMVMPKGFSKPIQKSDCGLTVFIEQGYVEV